VALRAPHWYSRRNAALAAFLLPYWHGRASASGQGLPPGPLSLGAYKFYRGEIQSLGVVVFLFLGVVVVLFPSSSFSLAIRVKERECVKVIFEG